MVCRKRRVAYGSGDTRYADKARGIAGFGGSGTDALCS